MDSIGSILQQERQKRGLSIEEVRDATRITVQNLTALEEDRFDYFPNRVYARAFLRDYANFLSLDSPELLDRYEEEWGTPRETQPVVETPAKASPFRALGYALLAICLLAVLAAAGYYGWSAYENSGPSRKVTRKARPSASMKDKTATLPVIPEQKAEEVNKEAVVEKAADKADSENVVETPKEVEPAKQPVSDKQVLAVKTKEWPVWTKVVVDGQARIQTLPAWKTTTFEGKSITIEVGLAKGVDLSLNGKPQPSLGNHAGYAKREFPAPTKSPEQKTAP